MIYAKSKSSEANLYKYGNFVNIKASINVLHHSTYYLHITYILFSLLINRNGYVHNILTESISMFALVHNYFELFM